MVGLGRSRTHTTHIPTRAQAFRNADAHKLHTHKHSQYAEKPIFQLALSLLALTVTVHAHGRFPEARAAAMRAARAASSDG